MTTANMVAPQTANQPNSSAKFKLPYIERRYTLRTFMVACKPTHEVGRR